MCNRLAAVAIVAAAVVAAPVAGLAPPAAWAAPPRDGPNVFIAKPPQPSLGALVTHPLAPERLVLGYGIGHGSAAGPAQIRRSVDGGRTWSTRVSLPRLRLRDWVGVPVLAFSGDGTVLYSAYVTIREGWEVILLTRSTDEGQTWASPTIIEKNEPLWSGGFGTTAIALAVQPARPEVLHLLLHFDWQEHHDDNSTLTLLTSTDGGASWHRTPVCPYASTYEVHTCDAGSLVVTPTGELLINYRQREAYPFYKDIARVVRSVDAGSSFEVVRQWSIEYDDPEQAAPNPGWGTGSLAVTPDGLATILYVRQSSTAAPQLLSVQASDIYHWGTPLPVMVAAEGTQIWGPRLAVARCGRRTLLQAVWVDRQGDTSRLAYARRLLNPDTAWTHPISLIRSAGWATAPLLSRGGPFAAWLAEGVIVGSAVDPGVACGP